MNEKKLLYVKEGRKYKPISEYYSYDYLPFGHYLLHVCEGSTSFRLLIEPEYAKVLAALYEYKDEACKVLMNSLGYRTVTPMTEKQ
jgi:hypothetical protein